MDEPIWEGGIFGKYKIKVMPIGEAVFRANLEVYDLEDNLLFQKEVLANRNVEGGANQKEYQNWQKTITDWVLNKS